MIPDQRILTGKGHLELISAKLRPVEALVKLGELLRVDELQLRTLKDAKLDITIGNKRVQVDDPSCNRKT